MDFTVRLSKEQEDMIRDYHQGMCNLIQYDDTRYYIGIEVGIRNILAMLNLKPDWMEKPNIEEEMNWINEKRI